MFTCSGSNGIGFSLFATVVDAQRTSYKPVYYIG